MPLIMNKPVIISSFDIFLRSIIGSKMAVKSVSAERQTKATDTVAILMDKKKSTQCPATMAPVKNNFKNVSLDTQMEVLVNLK